MSANLPLILLYNLFKYNFSGISLKTKQFYYVFKLKLELYTKNNRKNPKIRILKNNLFKFYCYVSSLMPVRAKNS